MNFLNRMERAESDFCDKLDAEGPVVIHDQTFTRSLIMRELAKSYYAEALDEYMRSVGIDPDSEDDE
jgi:hypothetical protein